VAASSGGRSERHLDASQRLPVTPAEEIKWSDRGFEGTKPKSRRKILVERAIELGVVGDDQMGPE
jgi:hypothetical protein